MEHVILVDEADREIGTMEKIEAHAKGLLHRAFSILLLNSKGEILIQKRANTKYHSAGLWTNTCCSHPSPGESMKDATRRKLIQEMGIDEPCDFAFKFTYRTELENDLVEHELDHVFLGKFDGEPTINLKEVEAYRWVSIDALRNEIEATPEKFTYWFKLIMNRPEMLEGAMA
ncbi:MAG TPA: isopentenyl-diphosphate Delta-isomerase [Cyclobacteriaceae bacterium]|nr:isopentenyl-diphosphate Delta-isomerase [Cyclobacteriaceae bacterium]